MSLPSRLPPPPDVAITPAAFSCVARARRDGRPALVVMAGELDLAAVLDAEECLRVAQASDGDVVCDLGGLWFMDLSGLQLLLSAAARAHDHGERLLIRNLLPPVRRLLDLTGAEDLLDVLGPRGARARR